MSKIKSNFHLIILLIAPFLSLLWHLENKHMPMSDPVGYLDAAYVIYQNFSEGNYFDFIVSIFNERTWRPVIFQLFLVPFLIFTSGNILLSVAFIHVLFTSLSAFFIYKIFNKTAGKYIAAIASSIICISLDIMFGGDSFPLYAEIAFIPFLIGTIYFLSKDNLFKSKKYTNLFSLFFILTILTRPVVGICFLAISLIFIVLYRHKSYLTNKDIAKGFLYPIFFIWVLFLSRLVPEISSSIINPEPPKSYEIFFFIFCLISILLCLLIIYYLFNKKTQMPLNNKNYFVKCMLISSAIIWFWYTPRFGSLYAWIYETSIGNQFKHQKDNFVFNNIDLLINAINIRGSLIIAIIFILFVVAICLSASKNLANYKSSKIYKNLFCNINLLILTSVPIPIILYFSTWQISYRKIAPIITLLLIFMLFNTLKIKIMKFFCLLVLSITLFFQTVVFMNYVYNISNNDRWISYQDKKEKILFLGSYFPYPVNSNRDAHANLINFLKSHKEIIKFNKVALIFDDSAYPVEPYLTKFLCEKNLLKCSFSSPKKFKYEDINYLKNHKNFLIINKINNDKKSNNIILLKKKLKNKINTSSPSELYSYYFTYLHASNSLHKLNIDIIKCEIFYKNYSACLLIKD